ncbi:transposase [Amycolatopsis echigonensis]|uniref:Transposase n=1 Tax=Amycolatopsis echigonensis TaxID=2576905 RepID=A0A2N3WF72_9PSEU|nr:MULTISPECIES: transposase [Amycolatopsis]PKV92540.1 transposase [Amycolatopsis niigatensis]
MTSTPQSDTQGGGTAADNVVVLGVDTHKDVHVATVITMLGVFLASQAFPTTAAGYEQMLAWARTFGTVQQAGVECTGSYGVALTRFLRAQHVSVIEVNQPDKATRRKRGKTDAGDAESAARAVLSGRATAIAKTGDGPVEMMRMFKLAKTSALKARTQAINQLKAVLVTTDPALRESLAGLSRWMLIRRCAELDTTDPQDAVAAAIYNTAPAGPAHPAPGRGDPRPRTTDHYGDQRVRPRPAAPPRHRPRQRRSPPPRCGRQPRPTRHRSILCGPVRHQPDRGVIRQDPTTPTQPRRRQAGQRRALPHRAHPPAMRSIHPRIPATTPD